MTESLTKNILKRNIELQKEIFYIQKEIENLSKSIANKIRGDGRIIFIGAGLSAEMPRIILEELWFNFQINRNKFLTITAAKNYNEMMEDWKKLENLSSISIFELNDIGLNNKDLIIGLSSSGISKYIESSLKYAKELGCETAVITNTSKLSTLKYIDHIMNTNFDKPTIKGLASAEGGTVQKVILDILIYNAMLFSGRIYKNRMIYIKPFSEKLEAYAVEAISFIIKKSLEDSLKILHKNNNSTEIAILTELLGISFINAEKIIKDNNYDFNKIIKLYIPKK